MSKNGTEFSRYATTFHEIIDGNKTAMAIFTKDLLKMGLALEDKDTIDVIFPTLTNDKDEAFIDPSKYSQLSKYYHGKNDLTKLLPRLETEFDSEFQERYSEELQDYDESKLIEFAHRYQLSVDEDDIDDVSKTIAELYASILKNVSAKKRSKPIISEGNLKSDKNNIVLSYTFTEPEKQALVRLCDLIQSALRRLKSQTGELCNKQHELKNLTDSKEDENWIPHLKIKIKSLIKEYKQISSELESLCADLIELLTPKQGMEKDFPKLIMFARNIGNDEYRITCDEYKIKSSKEFKYNPFDLMISDFNACIERILRVIDKL